MLLCEIGILFFSPGGLQFCDFRYLARRGHDEPQKKQLVISVTQCTILYQNRAKKIKAIYFEKIIRIWSKKVSWHFFL